ncbi:lycopene cyclase family protein [Rhodonellum sp.]|uniref:lycopene cyclase family protein n=1 Tax=Rhodonellum sp. TaxID=2231180 RepID=UPI002722A6EB|nr:lycopene cyclase family protein [Rhodonellum sp.]MDO9553076.1 lycopene cyclase family protein [Rhodonellum sp.]
MTYDFIVTGLGCAGMSFMYYLLDSELKHKKILLIDNSKKIENDRTWCYWAENPLEIHPKNSPLIFWDLINIIHKNEVCQKSLGPLKYYHIQSSDFYFEVLEKIKGFTNVTIVQDKVVEFEENEKDQVTVKTLNSGNFIGKKILNSILPFSENKGELMLKQVFLGWKIKSPKNAFDHRSATLMDFPASDSSQTEFFYILPFSETEALVEYTIYTQNSIETSVMEAKLTQYIQQHLGIDQFETVFKEQGIIPMTTNKLSKAKFQNIIPIGTLAGCTKPSTGFTFYDIQKHCKDIVLQLVRNQSNLKFDWKRKNRFTFYDNILLNIAVKWPKELPSIFKEMFEKNNGESILYFLNEESTFLNEVKILGSLKFKIFIKSVLQYERH